MSDEILSLIYTFSRKFNDPNTNLAFEPKNKNISAVIKNGNVNLALTILGKDDAPYKDISRLLRKNIEQIPGVLSVNIILTSNANTKNETEKKFQIDAKNIIAIASGKGGVGKSTFSVNLAVALQSIGMKVGLLDADIYGPSIPRMIGFGKKPEMNSNKKLVPIENYNLKCMSIGFILDEEAPTIWRGPMVMKALEQMFNGVDWGTLDYLIIDLPPGTGDAQLTLAQSSKLSGSIIISTPQDVALADARKGINMFKKVNVDILGIVENMSYFTCDNCNEKHFIFSKDGAKKEAEKFKVPFLGNIPIDKRLREQSDEGKPACIDNPDGEIAKKFISIATELNKRLNN
ncbi:Mrp/NBP35 family ATP-binding protein [Pelagibacteraceae bacterium]|nr:Mrp/NBP35 family ATP-binding protein [Pelagibacteraceae bacterium]